ncbi:hypothetical protein D3C75_1339070 [compost metagenome]
MGRLETAGHIDPAIELATQLRPELAETRRFDVELTGERLLQAGATINAVFAQADLQRTQVPALASPISLGLQDRWLPA